MRSFIGRTPLRIVRPFVCLQTFPRDFAKTFSARFRTGGADVGILPVYLALWAGMPYRTWLSIPRSMVLNMSRANTGIYTGTVVAASKAKVGARPILSLAT